MSAKPETFLNARISRRGFLRTSAMLFITRSLGRKSTLKQEEEEIIPPVDIENAALESSEMVMEDPGLSSGLGEGSIPDPTETPVLSPRRIPSRREPAATLPATSTTTRTAMVTPEPTLAQAPTETPTATRIPESQSHYRQFENPGLPSGPGAESTASTLNPVDTPTEVPTIMPTKEPAATREPTSTLPATPTATRTATLPATATRTATTTSTATETITPTRTPELQSSPWPAGASYIMARLPVVSGLRYLRTSDPLQVPENARRLGASYEQNTKTIYYLVGGPQPNENYIISAEVMHGRQHLVLLEAGYPDPPELTQWVNTREGRAFVLASQSIVNDHNRTGRPLPWDGFGNLPWQDYLNAGAIFYTQYYPPEWFNNYPELRQYTLDFFPTQLLPQRPRQ